MEKGSERVKRYRIDRDGLWFYFEAEHVYVRDNGTLVLADADREMLLAISPDKWIGVQLDEPGTANVEVYEHERKPDLLFGYPVVEAPSESRVSLKVDPLVEAAKVCREAAEWSEPKCNAEVCAERDEPRASRKSDPQLNLSGAAIAERLRTLLEEGKGLGLVREIAARMPKDDRVLTEEQYEVIVNRATQRTADRCIELTFAERDKVADRVVAKMLGSSFPNLKHEIEKVVDQQLADLASKTTHELTDGEMEAIVGRVTKRMCNESFRPIRNDVKDGPF